MINSLWLRIAFLNTPLLQCRIYKALAKALVGFFVSVLLYSALMVGFLKNVSPSLICHGVSFFEFHLFRSYFRCFISCLRAKEYTCQPCKYLLSRTVFKSTSLNQYGFIYFKFSIKLSKVGLCKTDNLWNYNRKCTSILS